MDEERLAKISEDALDEEEFAYGILIGENNYDGADGARTVRKLCGYIGELLAHIRAQQAQLAAVPVEAINRYWQNYNPEFGFLAEIRQHEADHATVGACADRCVEPQP